MDSSHLPITLPSDGGLPWYSLGGYDVLMTFAATPRILFTKLLGKPKYFTYELLERTMKLMGSNRILECFSSNPHFYFS